jgi:hypothetical protein
MLSMCSCTNQSLSNCFTDALAVDLLLMNVQAIGKEMLPMTATDALFTFKGYERATKLGAMHWNCIQDAELGGLRVVEEKYTYNARNKEGTRKKIRKSQGPLLDTFKRELVKSVVAEKIRVGPGLPQEIIEEDEERNEEEAPKLDAAAVPADLLAFDSDEDDDDEFE